MLHNPDMLWPDKCSDFNLVELLPEPASNTKRLEVRILPEWKRGFALQYKEFPKKFLRHGGLEAPQQLGHVRRYMYD